MTDWTELPTFDAHECASFYDDGGSSRNASAVLTGNRRHVRTASQRAFTKADNTARLLERLPNFGETIHCVMSAHVDGWSLVPAVLQLAAAPITRLWVATLGFNRENAEALFALLDARQVGRVEFLCSCYFHSVDTDVFAFVHAGLAGRGQRIAAVRSHAKLLLFEMTGGAAYVVESSANLRSRNVEQFTLTHDRALLEFHAGWMEELFTAAERFALRASQTPAEATAAGRQP